MNLADTLVAIFIFSIMIVLIVGVYLAYTNVFLIQIAQNELSSDSTIAYNRMLKQIRNGTRVMDSHTINSTLYTTDSDTLVLEIPAIDSNDDIIEDTYDYLAIDKDGSSVILDIDPDAASSRATQNQILTPEADTLVFNYNSLSNPSVSKVEIIMVTSKTVRSNNYEQIMQSSTKLRNI